MYPLKVCLVGCGQKVIPELKRELNSLAVTVDAEWPDIRSAIAELTLTKSDTCLLIVQPDSIDELRQLERLNEVHSGQPILALVDLTVHDPSMLLRAMRSGAAQVVRAPIQADDFKSAMRRIAVQFGSPPPKSKVIAVCGSTGGCGATTIAINLAAEIAEHQQQSCVLVEASVQFGRLADYLAVQPALTTSDLLNDLDRLDIELVRHALTKISDNFHVLVGSHKKIALQEPPAAAVLRLHHYIRQLASVIVVDMPQTFDLNYFDFLMGVDKVVVVFEQKVSSIRGAQMILEALEGHGCTATPHLVINRYHESARAFSADRILKLLNVNRMVGVTNDRAAAFMAETNGRTLRQQNPRSRALADIRELSNQLMDQPDGQATTLSFGSVCSSLANLLALR